MFETWLPSHLKACIVFCLWTQIRVIVITRITWTLYSIVTHMTTRSLISHWNINYVYRTLTQPTLIRKNFATPLCVVQTYIVLVLCINDILHKINSIIIMYSKSIQLWPIVKLRNMFLLYLLSLVIMCLCTGT